MALLPASFGRRFPNTLVLSIALGVLFCSQLWILSDVDLVGHWRGSGDKNGVDHHDDAAIVLEVVSQRSRIKPLLQPKKKDTAEAHMSGGSSNRVSREEKARSDDSTRSRHSPSTKEAADRFGNDHDKDANLPPPSRTTATTSTSPTSSASENTNRSKAPVKEYRFMSSVMNFSCSAPFTLAPGSHPTPLNVSSSGNNATHFTCSMGCTNVTLPNQFPSFIIIGSQKGGTSALYHYFSQLPTVLSSSTFEPHWFDMEARTSDRLRLSPERLCQMRHYYLDRNFDLELYHRKVAEWHPSPIFTFEKTPAYLRSLNAPYYTHLLYSKNIKLLAILRNPVTRTYSQYEMEYHRGRGFKIADSFQEWVEEAVNSMRVVNLTVAPTLEAFAQSRTLSDNSSHGLDFALPVQSFQDRIRTVGAAPSWHKHKKNKRMEHNTLYVGMYALQLSQWLQYFELGTSLMVVQFEKLLANKTGVFGDICGFLGIPKGQLNESAFENDYRPVKEKKFKKGVPIEPVDPFLNETREYLEHFFRPYNDELARLLGKEWENVW